MNEICDEGAKTILDSLGFNTTLSELDMSIDFHVYSTKNIQN